jgi:ribonuclease BN (tRNA processing enzyme)
MLLTVLGKYGPYPAPGGACSGYLLSHGDTRVLIDCGSGVLSRLLQILAIQDLDAVILSHLHGDHMSDMLVLRYALEIQRMRGLIQDQPLPVFLPETPQEEYGRIQASSAFDLRPLHSGMQFTLGSLAFECTAMTHPVESYGIAVMDGEKRAVYTGDTNYNPGIVSFARGAAFLWADTGLLERDKVRGKAPHLSAREVGSIARDAGVGRLMLSHFWPGYAEGDLLAEAAACYPNPILAEEMKSYTI